MKTCSKCKESKSADCFHNNRAQPDGLHNQCKICKLAGGKAYYQRDPEKVLAINKAWKLANLERVAEKNKEWRDRNLEEVRAKSAAYARNRRSDPVFAEAERQVRNTDEYRNANRIRNNKYLTNNPGKRKEYKHRRRALEMGAEGYFTAEEWYALCERHGNKCVCCGTIKPLAADHIVPLSKDGTNYISNIQPLCKSCNSRKHKKIIRYIPSEEESLTG